MPVQDDITQDQNAAPQQNAQDDDQSPLPADASAGGVNIMRLYSNLNAKITDMLDGLGIRRSVTLAHQPGQSMEDHVADVSKALSSVGGMTKNFITATHSAHAADGGRTVAHSTEKLHTTTVPKNCEPARLAIQACSTLVSRIGSILPEKELHHTAIPQDAVKRAKAQLALISKSTGAGMSAFDLAAALIAVPTPLIQLVARLHSQVKHNGEHHAALTGPQQQPDQQQPDQQQPEQQQ